ncbi:HET domain-containing protein [Fusarium sp. LHS14.1]|nr:HET domain-containing protein [Fusarium sp. LHS14.1]
MDSLASLTHRVLGKSAKKTSRVLSESRVLYGQNPNKVGYSYQGDLSALRMILDAKIGDAIFSLFSRVYWRRIWIIQEVLLAKEIRIVCGPRCTNWNKLNSFFGGMEFSMLQSGSAPISDLLLSFGNFECRDRRDKVYGMLGLSSDIVDVNYAKSVQHIYNDVIRRIVRGGQMDTISKAEYFGRRLASTLGIRMDDRQLIRTDSLFICPPRLLTWADERPFWENDPAMVLPRPYYNHAINILSLSMTPSRLRPQISQGATPSTDDTSQAPQTLSSVSRISLQAVVAVAPQIVQPTDLGSRLIGYDESDEESHVIFPGYSDASSFWVEGMESVEPPPYVESWLESRRAHAFDFLAPDVQPRCKDDSEVPFASSSSIDYLSHEWSDKDVGPSWKAVSSMKSLNNKDRLENVIWRAWTKFKNNLSTISPEELNWLKDCDVTWLYGPLYPDSQSRPPNWQPNERSILRRRRAFDSESLFRGKKRIGLKVRIQEEVEVIGYDGGLGYFVDEDGHDTATEQYTDAASYILSRNAPTKS